MDFAIIDFCCLSEFWWIKNPFRFLDSKLEFPIKNTIKSFDPFEWGQNWIGVCPHEWSLKLSKLINLIETWPCPQGKTAGSKNAGNVIFWKSTFWRPYELWLPPLTPKSNFEKKELLVTNYCPRYYRADIKLKSDIIIIKRKEKLFMRIFINFICLIEITKICFNLLWTNKTCFYFSFIGLIYWARHVFCK